MSIIHCLPSNIRDPFGRPILIIKAPTSFGDDVSASKLTISQMVEQLRVHLQFLDSETVEDTEQPALQYIAIVDLRAMSIQTFNIDLVTWVIREVIPRFPGMLAGVMMINYSWAHSGVWRLTKLLLPSAALSRVFFPTQAELVQYFGTLALPSDYGGILPLLTQLKDPLRITQPSIMNSEAASTISPLPPSHPNPTAPPEEAKTPTPTWISPTSLVNPYYGYPAASYGGLPFLSYGRRRKRDLIRTLLTLLWGRWGSKITVGLWIGAFSLMVLVSRRKGLIHWTRFGVWKRYPLPSAQS